MSQTISELVAGTRDLRSLPSTTLQLLALLDDATVDASTVLGVIEKDPSLTANLLKLANSAYYGLRRQVGSVREGLVLLGNQTIVNLAFATSMGDVMRGPLAAYRLARNELWRHSLCTALGARHLAKALQDETLRERAFTAGLVHDIGKLLLSRPLKEHLDQLPPDGTFGELVTAERDILGFDHAQAGAALAEAWNFPADLTRVIRDHHGPAAGEDEDALTTLVTAANWLSCRLGNPAGTGVPDQEAYLAGVASLGVAPDVLLVLPDTLPGELETVMGVVGGAS